MLDYTLGALGGIGGALTGNPVGIAAGAGGGYALGAFFDNMFGWGNNSDEDESNQTQWKEPTWYQTPDYTEASGARGQWWDTLQNWLKSGSYGANMPNFDAVYDNAKNRINQYYWGGPSGGGLIDKIRAGAARRGVAESPAVDVLTQRAGAEQANKLADVSANLDLTKANTVENARMNWLNSVMALSQLKPSGTWSTGTPYTNPEPTDYIPTLIGSGVDLMGNYMQGQNLANENQKNRDLLAQMYPAMTQSSLTAE